MAKIDQTNVKLHFQFQLLPLLIDFVHPLDEQIDLNVPEINKFTFAVFTILALFHI
jgi:hypothetical protein